MQEPRTARHARSHRALLLCGGKLFHLRRIDNRPSTTGRRRSLRGGETFRLGRGRQTPRRRLPLRRRLRRRRNGVLGHFRRGRGEGLLLPFQQAESIAPMLQLAQRHRRVDLVQRLRRVTEKLLRRTVRVVAVVLLLGFVKVPEEIGEEFRGDGLVDEVRVVALPDVDDGRGRRGHGFFRHIGQGGVLIAEASRRDCGQTCPDCLGCVQRSARSWAPRVCSRAMRSSLSFRDERR